MFCTYCGKEVQSTDDFCIFCGGKINKITVSYTEGNSLNLRNNLSDNGIDIDCVDLNASGNSIFDMENELKEYMGIPSKKKRRITVKSVIKNSVITLIFIAVPILFIAYFFFILIPNFFKKLDLIQALNMEKRANNLENLYFDFKNSISLNSDSLKVGKKYLFCRNKYSYYMINDIVRVYQYIHSTNCIEDKRELRADLAQGGTVTIAYLNLRGQSDFELAEMIAVLKSVNSSICIGTR